MFNIWYLLFKFVRSQCSGKACEKYAEDLGFKSGLHLFNPDKISMYQYVLVCTSTHHTILFWSFHTLPWYKSVQDHFLASSGCRVCTGMYWVCTGLYTGSFHTCNWYVQVWNWIYWFWLVCTGMYGYVLVCPGICHSILIWSFSYSTTVQVGTRSFPWIL